MMLVMPDDPANLLIMPGRETARPPARCREFEGLWHFFGEVLGLGFRIRGPYVIEGLHQSSLFQTP